MGKAKRSSHCLYHRRMNDERTVTAVVILGKREIPKGTLKAILANLEIDVTDFLGALH